MTVETEVANLTTAVDNLTSAVNVRKATLDASVADAQSAQSAAAASASTASGHAVSAAASASAAAATASGLAGFDLDAISTNKAVTAVDVFVYDTSKDSDGGAWRKRTQHTSWYNETLNTATRGSRREFPAVAVIVAEATKVTIYDGDDPSLPMWMVFNGNGNYAFRSDATAISALNGVICVSTSANKALQVFKFTADYTYLQSVPQYERGYTRIVDRNIVGTWVSIGGASIVDTTVNDLAMTVLPDAPIDPATGLPVPTIAVATQGGVSVIKDDGTVVDIIHSDSAVTYSVDIYDTGYVGYNAAGFYHRRPIPTDDVAAGVRYNKKAEDVVFIPYTVGGGSYTNPTAHPPYAASTTFDNVVSGVVGFSAGITQILPNHTSPTSALYSCTTSTYNTGWMNGNIKGAFLSDTDDTDLVGSGELVTNGAFDTDTSGWTATADATISSVSGELNIENTTLTYGGASQAITCVVGKRYTASVNVKFAASAAQCHLRIGTTLGGSEISGAVAYDGSSGNITVTFVATSTTHYVSVTNNLGLGSTGKYDNISVKLADADRSVNNKGLIVNGTVTRTAVATGADLVAYSGFSASNYLEQPYNSDLDFGTGDFCVMGWVKLGSTPTQYIFDRQDGAGNTTDRFNFAVTNTRTNLFCRIDTTTVTVSKTLPSGVWTHLVLVREAGVAYFYVDGVLAGSGAQAGDNTDASASYPMTILGQGTDKLGNPEAGALLRISATAPTAEQIAKIYNDEKVLFQEGAQATLYGASDAVTALAHDSDTGLLHVGTSAGRSVFQGLRRVSNTTTAVGTAISASNGLVVEE
jgi:hypothetical protein